MIIKRYKSAALSYMLLPLEKNDTGFSLPFFPNTAVFRTSGSYSKLGRKKPNLIGAIETQPIPREVDLREICAKITTTVQNSFII